MEGKEIKYRYRNIGRWLARCNHDTWVIELNRKEFHKLSPVFQDFIWVHEHVHLLMGVRNEAECDKTTNDLFLLRSKSLDDLKERQDFINQSSPMSTLDITPDARVLKTRKASPWAVLVVFVLILCLIKKN